MAYTLDEIVYEAFRDANIVAAGQSLTSSQLAEGRSTLKRVLAGLLGSVHGANLLPWTPPALIGYRDGDMGFARTQTDDEYHSLIQNIHVLVLAATTFTMPLTPSPGSRVRFSNPTSGIIEISLTSPTAVVPSLVTLSTGQPATFVYMDHNSTWTNFDALLATDYQPFDPVFDDYIIFLLMKRLASRYGVSATAEYVSSSEALATAFRARYSQRTERPPRDAGVVAHFADPPVFP